MPKHRTTKSQSVFSHLSHLRCDTIAVILLVVFVAYQVASKLQACSVAEESFVRDTMEILAHSACNVQRTTFERYGMDCEGARKKLSDTETGLRWWGCLLSSVSFLQSYTTWIAIGVCGYVGSLWLRFTNYHHQQSPTHVPPSPPPNVIYLQQPVYHQPEPQTRQLVQIARYSNRGGDSSSSSSYSEGEEEYDSSDSLVEIIP